MAKHHPDVCARASNPMPPHSALQRSARQDRPHPLAIVVRNVTLNLRSARAQLIMCRKQPGISVGRLCEKCDGKCPICDSYVRPAVLVRICDECNYGSYAVRMRENGPLQPFVCGVRVRLVALVVLTRCLRRAGPLRHLRSPGHL